MLNQRVYAEFLTGIDNDVLNDTELENAPGTGVYIVRAASTVNTATLAVKGTRSVEVSPPRAVQLRANGEILSQDIAWVLPVTPGERVTIAIGGTVGTTQVQVSFMGKA